jgi:hypothetical protein
MQHNHHSQPDQMLSGCSLPAGVINHITSAPLSIFRQRY